MDYEKAWKELKDFVIKQFENNVDKDEWISVIEYSELFIKMVQIESEVCNNDEQRKG